MVKLPFFERAKLEDNHFHTYQAPGNQIFLWIFFIGIFFSFVILFVRLLQITIIKGSYYQRLAISNHTKELVIEAPRGSIIDRKGLILADSQAPDNQQLTTRIESKRNYYDGEAFGHIIGYRQLADPNDLKNDSCIDPIHLGDRVGKHGIEKIFDCDLRGKPGKKMVEVDARGRLSDTIAVLPPQPGKNIQLALDRELQELAYKLIQNKKAAIIALKPNTGEILVLSSSPGFSSQTFENNNSQQIKHLLNDPNQPLFNRTINGTYPPGSIFKIIVATAGLESGKITPKTLIEDTGSIQAGSLKFGNWYFLQYGKTEGPINLVKAIQRSNDIYFYKAGEMIGPDNIRLWASRFGLGKSSNLGLNEDEGTLPSPLWKEEVLKEKWYLGDTYNYAIGQGYLLVTPLQIALATAVFANGGYLCQPQLLKQNSQSSHCQKLPISSSTLKLISKGMRLACETGGTGWPLFKFRIKNYEFRINKLQGLTGEKRASVEATLDQNPLAWKKILVACKTGTAESITKDKNPHAWFTTYAPFDKPEIVVSVLLENSGQGSDVAAPIARDILKAYFERSE